MKKDKDKDEKKSHKGKKLTGLLVAAGLAAAAITYLKKKNPDVTRLAKDRAKQASSILTGEARLAYDEVKQEVIQQIRREESEPTQKATEGVIKMILKILQKRGTLTTKQIQDLGSELKSDWKSIVQEARKK